MSINRVKKDNVQFSHILEDGLLGKKFGHNTQKIKIENSLNRNLCLSKKEVFKGQLGCMGRSWLSPCMITVKSI